MSILPEFSQYMPHGMCLLWQPWLLLLWGGSDVLIVISYFAIPFALLKVARGRPDMRHRGLLLLFASFILLCGVTHAMSVVTLWLPIYPLQGVLKLATGLVSLTTAIVLFKLVPTLITFPSIHDLETANQRLRDEVAKHEETLSLLRAAQTELEDKVSARTAELKEVNGKLEVIAREAVHRSGNLIAVVHSMARQTARNRTSLEDFIGAFLGRLNALSGATTTVLRGVTKVSVDIRLVVETQLEPVLLAYEHRVSIAGPQVSTGQDAAQQISLALHELATNAQKYGALSGDTGTVAIAWATEDGPDGTDFIFRWEEDVETKISVEGKDAPRKGFGLRLLTEIVPMTLDGMATRSLADGKLIYELRVPLAVVQKERSLDMDSASEAGPQAPLARAT